MLDLLNEQLITKGEEPVAFDHDCREGICGMCGLVINGMAHGPKTGITTCQLHMRIFKDGDTIAGRTVARQGVSRDQGPDGGPQSLRPHHPGGRLHLGHYRQRARRQRHSCAQEEGGSRDGCCGLHRLWRVCGGVSELVGHALYLRPSWRISTRLPQGQAERFDRAVLMVEQMDTEGFGGCTNIGECEAVCPTEISLDLIALMNRDLLRGTLAGAGQR